VEFGTQEEVEVPLSEAERTELKDRVGEDSKEEVSKDREEDGRQPAELPEVE
jgi:hypothetical protein